MPIGPAAGCDARRPSPRAYTLIQNRRPDMTVPPRRARTPRPRRKEETDAQAALRHRRRRAGVALAAPVVVGDSDQAFTASLNGYLEVPSISTTARGSFRAEVVGSTINYRLVFRDLSTPSLFSHIHFARPDVNGGSPPSCAVAADRHVRPRPGR